MCFFDNDVQDVVPKCGVRSPLKEEDTAYMRFPANRLTPGGGVISSGFVVPVMYVGKVTKCHYSTDIGKETMDFKFNSDGQTIAKGLLHYDSLYFIPEGGGCH